MSHQIKIKCPRCFIVNDNDRCVCRNCNTPLRGWRRKVPIQEHTTWDLYDKSQNKPKHVYRPTVLSKNE